MGLPVALERIQNKIFLIRGQKIMLDRDLAQLYAVQTKNLNKAVRRNIDRFPADFMFQLTHDEAMKLSSRFQSGTLKRGYNIKYLPYAFTENGVAMLSSVLKSERAIQVNVQIMRTFTKLRKLLAENKGMAERLNALEKKFKGHDGKIQLVFRALRQLVSPPRQQARKIGFQP
jgi:phage regulator Rha-like protein